MATTLTTPHNLPARSDSEFPHRLRLSVAILAAASLIIALSIWGFDYYRLDLAGRAESPLHPMLRPSGSVGLRLGMLGIALYAVLFLYPIRKRWRWLGSIGKTRHWLDFHVLVGITAPILITFHASFKLRGLAGMAYWIMMAVALSGFIGRYMYAQIPRSLNADQIAFGELEQQAANLASELERQELFRPEEVAPLLNVPSAKEIRAMPLVKVLATLIRLDLSRPFLVSRLRRRVLSGSEILTTLGGFRRSGPLRTGNRDCQRSPPVLAAHEDGVPRTHASGVSSLARRPPAVQLFFRRSGGCACHRCVDDGLLLS